MDFLNVSTTPISGQRPGTSGLRKQSATAALSHYIENFVQSTFNALNGEHVGKDLVASGDGRFLNTSAMCTIIRMAAANGVRKLYVAVDFLCSTPAVSFLIRDRKCAGGFILTASHNPGGPNGDFGIKYNASNGGPASDIVTEAIYARTLDIASFTIARAVPEFPVDRPGLHEFAGMAVEVVDAAFEYVRMCRGIFDFPALRSFLQRPDFSLVFDGMHGVAGPFARKLLVDELGASPDALLYALLGLLGLCMPHSTSINPLKPLKTPRPPLSSAAFPLDLAARLKDGSLRRS